MNEICESQRTLISKTRFLHGSRAKSLYGDNFLRLDEINLKALKMSCLESDTDAFINCHPVSQVRR